MANHCRRAQGARKASPKLRKAKGNPLLFFRMRINDTFFERIVIHNWCWYGKSVPNVLLACCQISIPRSPLPSGYVTRQCMVWECWKRWTGKSPSPRQVTELETYQKQIWHKCSVLIPVDTSRYLHPSLCKTCLGASDRNPNHHSLSTGTSRGSWSCRASFKMFSWMIGLHGLKSKLQFLKTSVLGLHHPKEQHVYHFEQLIN